MLEITKLTHGHFGCWEETLSKEEKEEAISENVIDFLETVFQGKVIFFSQLGNRIGGWQVLKPDGTRHEKAPLTNYYSWFGPLP